MTHFGQLYVRWAPLRLGTGDTQDDHIDSQRSQNRLARILASWEGTPYAEGQGYRSVGCDCVRATVLILAEWMRWTPPAIETLPPDAALHNKLGAIRALRGIRKSLPPHFRIRRPRVVEPGDVLITGAPQGGPGHAIIVGTTENTLWQATRHSGFQRCGWCLPTDYAKLYAVLRFDARRHGS
jgi:hypothetical protein